jgi:rhamnopyranosyl-N-acetylglucosaminyl-diphospho-decaprenol beta-1,3/1,4-galactofuranosyltransferase
MNDPKVAAVIVTYNRFNLLKDTVAAVRAQSFATNQIIVVDNGSTDGSGEWLDLQTDLNVIHQANLGGSGGFHTGLKLAAKTDCDWAWVMDDDTICRPDTLMNLINKVPLVSEKIGFLSSKSIWTDGQPHYMNIPAITPSFNRFIPFNKYDDKGLLLVETSSFVSLLINLDAVKEVGLPYKEFFIWGDDQEYTRRLTKAGYLGLYCPDSVVLHKTPVNYFPDFYRDTPNNLWKHGHGFRNEFFMVKKNKGVLYFAFWLGAKVAFTSYKLIRIRNTDRPKFVGTLLNSAWKSILFNPKIDSTVSTNNQ